MTAVFKRELKSYFDGMTGYFFAAFLIFLAGMYTMIYCFKNLYPYYEYVIYDLVSFTDCHSDSDHEVYCGR